MTKRAINTVPSHLVRAVIESRFESYRAFGRFMGERYGDSEVWRKWANRLKTSKTVNCFKVDKLCVALGLHLSAFDPYYQEIA